MDTVFGEEDPDDLKAKMVSRIVNCAIYRQAQKNNMPEHGGKDLKYFT